MIDERTWRRLALILVVGVPLLTLWLGRGVLQTPDGLSYLADLRDGGDPVHPHHVLYGPLLALVAAALRPLGVDLLLSAQLLGLLSFVAVLEAGRRFASVHQGAASAFLALVLLACLRGMPLYAARVEVYMPLVAASAWLTVVVTGSRGAPTVRRVATAGALLGAAALCHQMGALLAVPVLVAPWAALRTRLLTVIGGGMLALAGSWIGWTAGSADAAFPAWLVTYARADVSEWGTFAHAGASGWRDLFGGIAAMVVPVPGRLAVAGAFAVAGFTAWLAWRIRVGACRTGEAVSAARFALAWLAVQLAFVLWWLPSDTDFAVPSLWPLWVLAVLVVRLPNRGPAPAALVMGAAVLALATYGVAMPRLVHQGDEARSEIRILDATVPVDRPYETDYETMQRLRWFGRPRTLVEETAGGD